MRGGGEFGPRWHQAAQGTNKHKSVDDLLAVAADLSSRGLTSPKHIGLQGGSNGGLIVASAFVREPQAFGAMVCEMPLTDMLRYPYLSAGSSWVDEYGHPEDPAFQTALSQLSPYHNLSDGPAYPPALITTSLSDDRVHPAHALKFYAKLKHNGSPAWLYAGGTGGHTGNTTQEESVTEFACILAFLNRHIGTEQQEGKKEEAV